MKELDIDAATYEQIARAIHSADSPVGIDAKKTHVLILEKLIQLEKRLIHIEQQLEKNNAEPG